MDIPLLWRCWTWCQEDGQSLPNPRSTLKSTLIGNTLYLMGGNDHTGPAKTVHHVDLNELVAKALSNLDTPTLWQTLQEVPLELSAACSQYWEVTISRWWSRR